MADVMVEPRRYPLAACAGNDVVLVDSPPSLGVLTLNAVAAAAVVALAGALLVLVRLPADSGPAGAPAGAGPRPSVAPQPVAA